MIRVRLERKGNKYPNCRNPENGECQHQDDCRFCDKCPVCGGRLKFEQTRIDIQISFIAATCVNCGAWMERGEKNNGIDLRKTTRKNGLPTQCSVVGCKHRTWSQYTITINNEKHGVCDRHKRQHQRWMRLGQNMDMPHLEPSDVGLVLTMRKLWGRKKRDE